jgi:AAA domain
MPDGMKKLRNAFMAVPPKLAEPRKPKLLVHGKPSVGKTWTAADFPGVYYIDTEGGAKEGDYIQALEASGGAYFGPEHAATSFNEVLRGIKARATEDHTPSYPRRKSRVKRSA